jgi:hypothetical protein
MRPFGAFGGDRRCVLAGVGSLRVARVVSVTAFATSLLLPGLAPPAVAAAPGQPRFERITVQRVDTAGHDGLPPPHSGDLSHRAKPFHGARTAARAGSTGAPLDGVTVIDSPSSLRLQPSTGRTSTASTTPSLSLIAGFPAMSAAQQISALGPDQNVTPPDTDLAAGPNDVVELINDSGSVWSKSGAVRDTFDLNNPGGTNTTRLFPVPSNEVFSDPRVLYDAPSGRWFASGLSFDPATLASQVYVAVSPGSDPTASWTVYTTGDSSLLHDQPKLGVSGDKVVVAWNDFALGQFFQGGTILVVQKSDMLAGALSASAAIRGPDSSLPGPDPAQELAYGTYSNAYVVSNQGFGTAALFTITGTPALGTVAYGSSSLGIGSTSTPPNADQPGAPGSIATNDDRFLGAVWQGGALWTSANDACTPSGDTATRPCARLVQLSTSGAGVLQSFDLASTGAGLYYPAVTVDGAGNMFATYTLSSASLYPGARVIGQSSGVLSPGQTAKTGEALYDDTRCGINATPSRWGDYSAAATDPQDPSTVWLGAEYAASSASTAAGCDWATWAEKVTLTSTPPPPPTPVAGVSPTSIAFGSHTVRTSTSRTVTVTNTGTGTLTNMVVTVSGASAFSIANNQCAGASLTAGQSCTVAVVFTPRSTGTFSGRVSIADNATPSTQTVTLSGKGVTHH